MGPGHSGTSTGTAASGTGAEQYGTAIQKALDALASGNREAFQRAIYEFDATFGLDKDKFTEDTRRFNETFGITQAGLTGNYQGAPTLPALTSYANQFGIRARRNRARPRSQRSSRRHAHWRSARSTRRRAAGQPISSAAGPRQPGLVVCSADRASPGFQAPNTVAGVGTARVTRVVA